MKKIFCLLVGIALLSLPSCMKLDNWDEPDCTFYGTVTDSYSNQPLLSSQNDWQIRIWERSWSGQPNGATTYQDLRIKQDGTFQNTKLFAGTYDIFPNDGPFWQADTIKSVVLKGKTKVDFTVTPYLTISDFSYTNVTMPENRGGGPGIWVKFKVKAPLLQKQIGTTNTTIPNLREVRIFLSRTAYCGNGTDSYINVTEYTDNGKGRIEINRSWNDILNGVWTYSQNTAYGGLTAAQNPADPANNLSPEFDILVSVKKGYSYNVRVGASSSIGSYRFNYSPVKKIDIQ